MDFTFLLLLFALMLLPMLLMGRGQKKRMQVHQEMVQSVQVGEEVRTTSGFYGLVVEKYDDVVILEAEDGSELKWALQSIAERITPTDAVTADTAETHGESGSATGSATTADADSVDSDSAGSFGHRPEDTSGPFGETRPSDRRDDTRGSSAL